MPSLLTPHRVAIIGCCAVAILAALSFWQAGHPAQYLMQRYLDRLANSLNLETPALDRASVLAKYITAPKSHDVNIPTPDIKVDLQEYWQLNRCGLSQLIARKNSNLGKVMPAQLRLPMERSILLTLEQCIKLFGSEGLQSDSELWSLSQSLYQQKAPHWPIYRWNGTVASPPLQNFWSLSAAPIDPNFIDQGKRVIVDTSASKSTNALKVLAEYNLQSIHTADHLQRAYETLEQEKLGGRLLQSVALSLTAIEFANGLLGDQSWGRTVCPNANATPQARVANTVMRKEFVLRVQPYLAAVNQQLHQVIAAYEALLRSQSADQQPLLLPWLTQLKAQQNQLHKSLKKHVSLWKAFHQACGLSL